MPRLMHWLNWYSAMLLNRLLRRRGHFWERRYHAVAVPDRDTGQLAGERSCPHPQSPLRPVERLVGQLVGEVFHFGFGRHYQFRHVVLL